MFAILMYTVQLMFTVIHETQVMTKDTEAYGYSEHEDATPASFRIFSSLKFMTIDTETQKLS